jgi:hypothetical protein
MKRVQFMLACVMAGAMGSAAAAPGPSYLGDLVGQNVEIFNSIAGLGTPFADIYSFDIGSFMSEAVATSLKVTLQPGSGGTLPIYDISNFAITLKDMDGVQYAFDDTFNANGALELSAILAPSTLGAPGFYQFVVTGTTAGTAGGIYAGALSAAPVPEPKAWLLMLAGFGLVGMMVERAKRRSV